MELSTNLDVLNFVKFKEKLKSKLNELAALQNADFQRKEEIKSLFSSNAKMNEENRELQLRVRHLQAEYDEERQRSTSKIADLVAEHNSQKMELKTELSRHQDLVQELRSTVHELKIHTFDLEQRMKENSTSSNSTRDESQGKLMDIFQTHFDLVCQQKESLSNRCDQLECDLTAYKEYHDALASKQQDLGEHLACKQAALQAAEASMRQLQETVQTLRHELAEQEMKFNGVSFEMTSLQGAMSEKETVIRNAAQDKQSNSNEICSIHEKLQQANKVISEQEESILKLKEQITQFENASEKAQKDRYETQLELKRQQPLRLHDELMTKCARVREEMQVALEQKTAYEEEIAKLKQHLAELSQKTPQLQELSEGQLPDAEPVRDKVEKQTLTMQTGHDADSCDESNPEITILRVRSKGEEPDHQGNTSEDLKSPSFSVKHDDHGAANGERNSLESLLNKAAPTPPTVVLDVFSNPKQIPFKIPSIPVPSLKRRIRAPNEQDGRFSSLCICNHQASGLTISCQSCSCKFHAKCVVIPGTSSLTTSLIVLLLPVCIADGCASFICTRCSSPSTDILIKKPRGSPVDIYAE